MTDVPTPTSKGWISRLRGPQRAGAVIVAIGIAAVLLVLLKTTRPQPVEVELKWKENIKQYGMEPVFPPQEDFAVGDIFVEVVSNTDPAADAAPYKDINERSPFSKRALKIDHIDVRDELEEIYGTLPALGAAAAPSTDRAAPPRLFHATLDSLPIAVFPDVTASNASQASTGWFQGLWARFGGSSESETEIALSKAETYGLPNARAAAILDKYCTAPGTQTNCTEATLRKYLRSLVGVSAGRTYLNVQTAKPEYAVKLRMFMVIRVFLALDIVSESRVTAASGANLATAQPAEAPARAAAAAATQPGTQARLDQIEQQITALQHAGASAGFATSDSRGFAINGTFSRPVAVGYLPMVYDPKPSEAQ